MIRQYIRGQKITEPGAYAGVPIEVYHAQCCDGPSISSSGLRTIFLDSPAHYWNESTLNPEREEKEQTEAIILGRAAHHLLLGETDFDKNFIIRPDEAPDGRAWNGNNLTCKNWLAEQALAGLTVLVPKQIEYIRGMSRALSAEPVVQNGILNGMVELSLFWRDDETGIWVKARPDTVPNDQDASDLKCVADISDDGISRGLGERGYHQQAALTAEGMLRVFDRQMENFFLVYVEQKRPHCVRINSVHPDDIAKGREENHAALRLFKKCLDSGYWPGPKGSAGDGGWVRRTAWTRTMSERRLEIINTELAAA